MKEKDSEHLNKDPKENIEDEYEEFFNENSDVEDDIELEEELEEDVDYPVMNVDLPENMEKKDIISDENILGIYKEIIDIIKEDRKEISKYIENFADMVLNGGDATSSAKEALVNLIKTKSDQSDKMSKIADLMTRIKLKEKDTFPRYLSANQNNTINVGNNKSKLLLKAIEKAKKKEKENKENE